MQLVEFKPKNQKGNHKYFLFNRTKNGTSTLPYASLDRAIASFEKRFKARTGNEWGNTFGAIPKKYAIITSAIQWE